LVSRFFGAILGLLNQSNFMRGLFLFAIAITAFDCNKDKPDPLPAPHPVMHYKDLPNAEVVYVKPKSVVLMMMAITIFNSVFY
jgi:hypothetical protein